VVELCTQLLNATDLQSNTFQAALALLHRAFAFTLQLQQLPFHEARLLLDLYHDSRRLGQGSLLVFEPAL
jgi:hypothetical protein